MPPKNKERFEILLEDMTDRIRLLAEGQTMQGDRLETKMEEGFKEQNRQLELDNRALTKRIDDGLAGVNKRIDRIDDGLAGVNKRIDRIDDGLAGVNKQIDEVNSSLTKKIDRVEASLTKEVRELKTDIREKVLPRLEDHEQRLTALEEKPAA